MTPPGRATRRISRTPAGASLMKFKTSWESTTSKVESANGSASAAPTPTSAPGTRLRHASTNGRDGARPAPRPRAEPLGERGGQPAGAASHVQRALPAGHAGQPHQPGRQLAAIAADVAVVGLGGCVEHANG